MASHPPCGLYRTTQPLGAIPAGRLVYFHDHGDPGPGVYLPRAWSQNRVEWEPQGVTVPAAEWSSTLAPLAPEGLYVVDSEFYCCENRCTRFVAAQLVQLGYDAAATPILFVPEWRRSGIGLPERGTRIDVDRVARLRRVEVARGPESPPETMLH